jgi:hypothetical protein
MNRSRKKLQGHDTAPLPHRAASASDGNYGLTEGSGLPLRAITADGSPVQKGTSGIRDGIAHTAHWNEAPKMHPFKLVDELMVPPLQCRSELWQRGGRRVYPERAVKSLADATPFARSSANSSIQIPTREMVHANLSQPVQWFSREVNRTVAHYNRGVVFTPNVRSTAVETALMRRCTIPEPPVRVVAEEAKESFPN